jgi:hypothetical protein
MQKLSLSLGFDTERPYGPWAETPDGAAFRKRQLAFIDTMNEKFDAAEVPRTHFILTAYLDGCRKAIGKTLLRKRFDTKNHLQDLQQHSHSHGIMSPLQGVSRPVMSADEYIADLNAANLLLADILDVQAHGLRTPYGYEHDLTGRKDILDGLDRIGITYVSSDLGSKATLVGELTPQRQPHHYGHAGSPDIVEVPAHGVQDVVYTKEKAKQLFGKDEAEGGEAIVTHYTELLDKAAAIPATRVSVALCLHPWAVMEYDPELELLLKVVRNARERGFDIKSYAQVAEDFRKTPKKA